MKKNVVIIGLGLIGSSLALTIRKAHSLVKITGIDSNQDSIVFAEKRGMIDNSAELSEKVLANADIIILCSPVKNMIAQLKEISQMKLKENVIITDVGSTKKKIVDAANFLGITNFIGGHPMAGSHKSGVSAGDVDLFENAYYILTPSSDDQLPFIKILQNLLSGTRAKFVILSSEEHDQITGMLSHVPHIIAAGLVNQSSEFNIEYPRSRQLAAGGFRDLTRIASSDPRMWTDILLSNQQPILSLMKKWQTEMERVIDWIATGDQEAIFQFFYEAKETRNQMPIHKEGAIPAFHDLFVDVPDMPGIIAEVTGILGESHLSLINIKILETREDVYGILQLTFKNQLDLQKAKEILERQTSYLCYEK